MRYELGFDDFEVMPYTSGTIQNINERATVEITTDGTENTGLVLAPHEKYQWSNATIYARAKWSDGEAVTVAVESLLAGGSGGGGGGSYILPVATASVLGGVKIGDGLSIESDGTLSASGGGDATLTEAITANTAAGAIAVNQVIAKDTTFTDFVKQLLISEIAPTTTFTATNSGLVKKGDSRTTVLTLQINTTGTGTPVSISFLEGSTVLDTQAYVSGTSTYTHTPSSSITTTTTFKAVLNYTKSDSTAATIEKSQTFTFVDPVYFGAVSTAPTTSAEVLAVGNETAANKRGRTVTYTLSNQKSCYCYPVSLGALTSVKDANNFEYISSYDRTTVTVGSVSYYVYTLHDPVTISGFKQIFA